MINLNVISDRKSEKRPRKSKKKNNDYPYVLSRGGYNLLEKKLMEEKMKKRQKEELLTENTPMIINPPSPIARHLK